MKPNEITKIADAVVMASLDNWGNIAKNHGESLRALVSDVADLRLGVAALARELEQSRPEPPAPESRLCSQCKHCRPKRHFFVFTDYRFAKCARPTSPNSDFLISGHLSDGHYCSTERQSEMRSLCGQVGRHFEPK